MSSGQPEQQKPDRKPVPLGPLTPPEPSLPGTILPASKGRNHQGLAKTAINVAFSINYSVS